MPVAYAVTYIFGTVGSAIVLALLGPALLGIDLEEACKKYEEEYGGKKQTGGPGTAWHQFDVRAFRVRERGPAVGKTVQQAEGAGARISGCSFCGCDRTARSSMPRPIP